MLTRTPHDLVLLIQSDLSGSKVPPDEREEILTLLNFSEAEVSQIESACLERAERRAIAVTLPALLAVMTDIRNALERLTTRG